MFAERALLVACLLISALIALPGMQAWRRRRSSREASEVAVGLAEFACAVRRENRCLAIDSTLNQRAQRLQIPEFVSFQFALQLPHAEPALLAQAAQRLALRLKRRVAFERKMLARTASGLRRGAAAAAVPALVLIAMAWAGKSVPVGALAVLLALEALGCGLLWRVARVEI